MNNSDLCSEFECPPNKCGPCSKNPKITFETRSNAVTFFVELHDKRMKKALLEKLLKLYTE
jgi:hypothetical protein